jgi:formylglycine-generating enzyme required for sulfatase activity
MKKLLLLMAFALILPFTIAFSQTMQVQTNSGNKTYNIDDVQSITFGKTSMLNLEMVEVPAGSFLMGDSTIAPPAAPVHSVNITKSFYIGIYEITQKQYYDVIGSNPSFFEGKDDNPVEQVNWEDAVRFCNELSKKEGLDLCYTLESGSIWRSDFNKKGYRLPTEAEWEYACRAGTLTKYYSGTTESQLASIAWYSGNSDAKTQSVGQKDANKFGLYDMSGNVWEWCWDWSSDYKSGNFDDPTGPDSGTLRVLRGGSWKDYASACSSAFRYEYLPSYRFQSIGFRVVKTK